ncbi:hypothetical protein TL16_g13202 [Triparma laevis f. inornata]|uniref:Uncharacterized protein n=1 Tax=Triparma laevis f. inornata TaxID=1714386 RepID=A0A9W7EYX8_9STRA|nr:hypothetical protein TL16_g13202 [Triparma laevis f. inornata]
MPASPHYPRPTPLLLLISLLLLPLSPTFSSSPPPSCSSPDSTSDDYFIVYPRPIPILNTVDEFYYRNYILINNNLNDDDRLRERIRDEYCEFEDEECTKIFDKTYETHKSSSSPTNTELLTQICSHVYNPLCSLPSLKILLLKPSDILTTSFNFQTKTSIQIHPYTFYKDTSHLSTSTFYCMYIFEFIEEFYEYKDVITCRDSIVEYIEKNYKLVTRINPFRSKFYTKYYQSTLLQSPSPSSPHCSILSPSLGCLFLTHSTDKFHAHGYNRIYSHLLNSLKSLKGNSGVKLLEIGVFRGSSMKVWEEFFDSSQSNFFGISYGKETFYSPEREEGNEYGPSSPLNSKTTLFYGDQSSPSDLKSIKERLPKLDIIIDDGSHDPSDQRLTFEILFHQLVDGGIYVIEDIETSYWNKPGAALYEKEFKQPLGVGKGRNVVDLFLKVVHYGKYVNGVFLGQEDEKGKETWNEEVGGWLEKVEEVASVEFAYNMIIIRKTTEADRYFQKKNSEYFHKRQTK